MRVLILSNMYPKEDSYFGSFVKEQVINLEKNGVQITKVVKTSENKFSYLSFFLRSLYHLLLKDYELVHAHYGFHSALSALIFKRTPLVVTYHRGDALEEPQRNPIYHWLQCLTIKKASHLVAVSQEIKNALVSKLNADENKVSVISCGVNTEVFKPYEKKGLKVQELKVQGLKVQGLKVQGLKVQGLKVQGLKVQELKVQGLKVQELKVQGLKVQGLKGSIRKELGLPEHKPIVLFPGHLSYRKGIDIVYQCASLLPDVIFVLIGKATPDFQTSIPNNCILVGPVPHSEIPKWLNATDIFFLPSRSEGTPVSLLEALACGVPAITSSAGGIPDVIKNGENGILISIPLSLQASPLSLRTTPLPLRVPPLSLQTPLLSLRASAKQSHIDLITNKITELLKSREKRELMSKKARESIKRFDQQEITDRIKEVYKKVL